MATIIDYAAGPPSAASIKAAGHVGVIRYISPARAAWMTGKPMKKAEVDDLKRHGLKIATVWQYGAGNAKDSDVMRGHAGGVADAKKADAHLKSVGLPGHPVFFAVDFDASLSQWNNTIVNYFKGAASVLGRQRVGIYGHSRAVHWAMEDNVVATVSPGRVLGWVTRSWSNGVVGADYSVLYQRQHNVPGPGGVQIDINDVHVAEWGHRALPAPPAVDKSKLPVVHTEKLLQKHFTKGRNGKRIQYITRHHLAGIGDTETVWGWWQTRRASAHYVVEATGKVGRVVRDEDTAWSNASTPSNEVSIAIEHCNSDGAAADWPISNTVIDGGARLAAELCLKHGLGRPQFGKNIRDHREFGATSCPHHLANGGKYHARWMRVAQEHYDKLTTQSKEDDMFTDNDRAMLRDLLTQATGNWKVGEFPGFDPFALAAKAREKLAASPPKGLTIAEMMALTLFEMRLAGDQLSGPGRTDKGARTFGGWDLTSALEAARKKNFAGVTLVEGVAVLLVGTDDDIAAVRRANKEEK